ncbi:hypothetical protein [Lichenifustis flavocetrariae]|uniref:Uncharacterized protein n=1 Tax=Lichenifustis flavocetrariae TaxID=2949735 RepID=A0AA42CIS3_9HYPH|nr:hypothetical protein [Lichenifustis flavocetrariae]MCW6508689.1 hypothetical protein [Lichenifustis flavocetrariae]
MGVPNFRFVASSDEAPELDAQFWRDVDASDRLASRFKANLYLRELCRSKAWDEAGFPEAAATHFAREHREAALLREVRARGYRLFGSDLDDLAGPRLAIAG